MRTLRAVLLGLVLTLSIGAASSAAATAARSTCLVIEPSANANICGVKKPTSATVTTLLPLDPRAGTYQLSITTSKPGGLTRLVRWSPPVDLTITAITRIEHGRCSLAVGRLACVATPHRRSMLVTFAAEPDVVTVLTYLNPEAGLYRLSVTNRSGLGSVDGFSWHPPVGMVLTSITSSQGAQCTLQRQVINCRGGKRSTPPPKCTCLGRGSLTVDFYADGLRPLGVSGAPVPYGVGAMLQVLPPTPVPYNGPPSFLPTDLPLCGSVDHKSTISTKASPCITK